MDQNDNKKIKLLLLTQRMDLDDDLLGFMHGWTAKLAGYCDKLTVVALGVGRCDLPSNVKVLSLGKEKNSISSQSCHSRESGNPGHGSLVTRPDSHDCRARREPGMTGRVSIRIKYTFNFYKYIWCFRNEYDYVFVHMNKEYMVLGGLWWRLGGKKTALWYNHRYGNGWGWLAGWLANIIFFTSPFSFFSQNKKAKQMPAGIDTEKFKIESENEKFKIKNSILFLGRISPVKKPDVLLEAVKILDAQGVDFLLDFIGEPGGKDAPYFANLKKEARQLEEKGKVRFLGKVSNEQAPAVFNQHKIFVNLTDSGSFDKTILEAMACEIMPLVSSRFYEKILPAELIFREGDAQDLSVKLLKALALSEGEAQNWGQKFRQYVLASHSLDLLAEEISASFKKL